MNSIVSRREASASGIKRYFTGKPCNHGHIAERYTANAMCVACTAMHNRDEGRRQAQKAWGQSAIGRERAREYSRNYHAQHREHILAEMKVRNAAYYEQHRERIKAATAHYQRANRDVRNAYKSQWASEKARVDPAFAMLLVMRKLVSRMMDRIQSGREQRERTTAILGYTPDEFVSHIQRLFQPGMTWANHGEWHIDHIRPLASFDLTDPVQRCMANSLHNLQPLWAERNLKKSDKWSGQMSLI